MTTCNFLFDAVVTRLESRKVLINDPKRLKVELILNKKTVLISASCINISDFKPGKEVEFKAAPKDLREDIEKCGIAITVTYGHSVLGSGHISFPQDIVDGIDEGMTDLVYTDTSNFERNAEVVGSLELHCRLVIKCEDEQNGNAKDSDCRRNIDTSIRPQDIMFIMSQSQRCPVPCDPCLDAWEPEEGDELLKLEFGRYRSIDTSAVKHDEIFKHDPIGKSVCTEIKKMAEEYVQVIDLIVKRIGLPQPPCRTAEALRSPCGEPCTYPATNKQPKSPQSLSNVHSSSSLAQSQRVSNPKQLAVSISEKEKPLVRPIRLCPVCLNNISWLPKFGHCPNCAVKPMPIFEEPHSKPEQTSDNILMDYLNKTQVTIDANSKDPSNKGVEKKSSKEQYVCRCTCKYGKLCAHCRVRQQYPEFITDNTAQPPEPEEESDYSDPCVTKEESPHTRPFLAALFSELRIMHDLKDLNNEVEEINKTETEPRSKKMSAPIIINREKQTKQSVTGRSRGELVERKRLVGIGHKYCAKRLKNVSRHHGWAWASSNEARKHGWRPGAILRPMKKLMNYFLSYTPEESVYNKSKKQMEHKKRQLPLLNLSKKNGEIFITLRGINNKHIVMNPIVFKVVKSDLAVALSEIKEKLKLGGFRKCTCHQTVMMCVCRNILEKKHLENALQMECDSRHMESCVDGLVLTDTSESEMEYDFDIALPVGVGKLAALLQAPQKCTVNRNTQTVPDDQNVPSRYPIMSSPYWRSYDCAVGPPATAATPRGKSHPGGEKKRRSDRNKPIPKRMPKRY